MPLKLRRSVRAKRYLRSYTRYSKATWAFTEMRRKHRKRFGSHLRRSLRDNFQSTSLKIKLLSDNVFELLQPEFLDERISGISSDDLSSEDSSDGISDEDTSDDDLEWIYEGGPDEDISMSDTSSDNEDDSEDSAFADDELDSSSGDTEDEDTPCTSFRAQIFNELKQMYAHRYEASRKRLPKPREPFMKHLLKEAKHTQPDLFRLDLRVTPLAFDRLVEAIRNDPVFASHSELSPQAPVEEQLAVALYRFGHNGNAASLQLIANWAGIGKGTVGLYTRRVMVALLRPEFMRNSIHWPDEGEKEKARKWVQDHSCKAWQNGWCFVDGTLVPLTSRPYWYGESYFDRKCRYSLNVQVCSWLLSSDIMTSF